MTQQDSLKRQKIKICIFTKIKYQYIITEKKVLSVNETKQAKLSLYVYILC